MPSIDKLSPIAGSETLTLGIGIVKDGVGSDGMLSAFTVGVAGKLTTGRPKEFTRGGRAGGTDCTPGTGSETGNAVEVSGKLMIGSPKELTSGGGVCCASTPATGMEKGGKAGILGALSVGRVSVRAGMVAEGGKVGIVGALSVGGVSVRVGRVANGLSVGALSVGGVSVRAGRVAEGKVARLAPPEGWLDGIGLLAREATVPGLADRELPAGRVSAERAVPLGMTSGIENAGGEPDGRTRLLRVTEGRFAGPKLGCERLGA